MISKTNLVCAVAVFGATLLWSALVQGETLTKSFQADSIKRLHIATAVGKVMVTGQDSKVAKIAANKKDFDPENCQLKIAVENGTLVVAVQHEGRGKKWFESKSSCEVDFAIEVPRHLEQRVKNGAGDVVIAGTKGAVEIETGAGAVDFTDVEVTELRARSGVGDIKLAGSVTNAQVRLGVGNFEATLNEKPEAGSMNINTGTGSAVIRLPEDSAVSAEFAAGMGSMESEIEMQADAPFTISMRSGQGNLQVRKL